MTTELQQIKDYIEMLEDKRMELDNMCQRFPENSHLVTASDFITEALESLDRAENAAI